MTAPGADGSPDRVPVCLADFAGIAEARLPPPVWDFLDGGSADERLLAANRAAFDRISLLPRVLTGVSDPATGRLLLGTPSALPLAVAPMAYQCLFHEEGEVAVAHAAAAAGVPMVVSTLSSRPLEEIRATGATVWLQLYWLRDRGRLAELLRHAEAVGCTAVMLTVDVPVMARRLRDARHSFVLPRHIRAAVLDPAPSLANVRSAGRSAVAEHTADLVEPRVTWDDLVWLRRLTRLPLVVKGVLHADDAVRAVQAGADAVVVSNHGGRQFPAAAASVAALPRVVDAVAGRAGVLLDSGVRSGTDVLRALALGADGVLLGRPVLWGLAAGGGPGVSAVLDLVRDELVEALVLSGCADPAAARRLETTAG